MPVISGMVTSYDVPTNARDVSKAFYLIKKEETPLLNAIPLGDAAKNTEHYYWDDVRQIRQTVLTAGYTSGGGSLQVASTAGMVVNMLLATNGKVYKATSITDNTHVAVSVADGGADANQANGSVVLFLGTASKEGKDYEDRDYTTEVERYNVTQILDDYVRITGTEQSITREVQDGDIILKQIEKKLERLYLMLGRSIWNNPRVVPSDNNTPRILGSVDWFIRQNGYVPASATFNVGNFDAFLLQLDKSGANLGELWMNPATLTYFSDLQSSQVQMQRSDTDRGTYAVRYNSRYGHHLDLKTDMQTPVGGIYAFRTADVKLCPLMGRQFQVKELAKTGDADKRLLVGEYTLEVRNSAISGIFTPS